MSQVATSASAPASLQEDFRAALSLWPSGVTIVTTVDGQAQDWGFTASAFSSLSLNPPLVLVCLDAGAECHDAFLRAGTLAVNVLRPRHAQLAMRFATKGADKFGGDDFLRGQHGAQVLPDAAAVLECSLHSTVPAGDHTIVIGQVLSVTTDPQVAVDGDALLHFARGFRPIPPA